MVFEEEDFQLAMYSYRLSPDISDLRVIGMLREVETELNETIHSSSNASTTEVSLSDNVLSNLAYCVVNNFSLACYRSNGHRR